MIITRTPFRISLFGGGTDHPIWFEKNGGLVVSFAINKFCYISTRTLPPFFEHKYRVAYSQVETVKSIERIRHPVVRECILKYAKDCYLEIHHDGDLPARSGIGSSSAFVVGMIQSLLALRRESVSRSALADFAIEMEREVLKENVGWQDQIACSIGGINRIEFSSGGNWQAVPIRMKPCDELDLTSRMVLIFTGVHRFSTDVTLGLIKNLERKASSESMLRMMNLASECHSILSSSGDLDLIGEMLDESWKLKKSLNPLTSNDLLDTWYDKGRKAGALGGKILGAGGGGFFLYWVKEGEREKFLRNMGNVTAIPIKICHDGASVIYRGSDDD